MNLEPFPFRYVSIHDMTAYMYPVLVCRIQNVHVDILFFSICFTSHNKLSSLPVSMASLASLSSLKLDHNSLETLGIELSQMKQLEEMVSVVRSFYLPFFYTAWLCEREVSCLRTQAMTPESNMLIIRPLHLHTQGGEVW